MNLSKIFNERIHSNFWTINHLEYQTTYHVSHLFIKLLLPSSLSQVFQTFKADFFCSSIKLNTLNTGFYINSIDILILYIPKKHIQPPQYLACLPPCKNTKKTLAAFWFSHCFLIKAKLSKILIYGSSPTVHITTEIVLLFGHVLQEWWGGLIINPLSSSVRGHPSCPGLQCMKWNKGTKSTWRKKNNMKNKN